MHRGISVRAWIGNENRNTISSLDRQQDLGCVADEGVAILIVAEDAGLLPRIAFRMDHADIGAMNLPTSGQGPFTVEETKKAAPVFVDIFRFVFVEAGQVERVFGHRTDAADPG